ncbi:putative hsp90 co-chaperone cdc37 [Diaporthe ampelina]|uniref:Hsp90 chaperone protein kinase-targeting subunit n=1 Tax=Diaporthe ampelina TaxID=1214573 RepID=A0A0G2IG44_9PEZI|nr:putative hsp90 co-chaperone cdc37 [Diaporthe ampelina]
MSPRGKTGEKLTVHPNVDKRSFIRAKQNQIHQEREQRKQQIITLKYERQINDALIQRITSLLNSLKAHAADVDNGKRSPGEVAFAAVMESAANLKPEDDTPPPRPAGVHNAEEKLPTYSKMMATLLDQVNQAMEEKKVKDEDRYAAMVSEIQGHLDKVTDLQKDLHKKLDELEKEEARKITSESIHTGFDSSHVAKATAPSSSAGKKGDTQVELLNPNFSTPQAGEKSSATKSEDDEEVEASPAAKQFAKIQTGSYSESLSFLGKHPEILQEKETDGLLIMAFDAQLNGNDEVARQCVHQGLLLQYCRALGRDGVGLFFKRIMTKGHQAQDVFFKDVQDTYLKIKARTAEINKERAASSSGLAEGEGVEQIQLHAVEPGTVINIQVPPADSEDPEIQEARKIFEGFSPEMKKALESGSLDQVNKVLGDMKVEEAEDLVGKFSDAGVLSLEQQVIDATTDQGKAEWKQLQDQGKATTSESQYADDPE